MYQRIDAPALKNLLETTPETRLVDVRTPAEVARGRIPGAEHIELATLAARIGELDPHATWVFYCGSGGRSAQACTFAAQKGFTNVYNLEGGIVGWAKAGLPSST
jgi:rhodanese-related sulfurtransferase